MPSTTIDAIGNWPPLGPTDQGVYSEPLGPDELRGHVVLVDFWTLTCINWLRVQPYIRAWSRPVGAGDWTRVTELRRPRFSGW